MFPKNTYPSWVAWYISKSFFFWGGGISLNFPWRQATWPPSYNITCKMNKHINMQGIRLQKISVIVIEYYSIVHICYVKNRDNEICINWSGVQVVCINTPSLKENVFFALHLETELFIIMHVFYTLYGKEKVKFLLF